MQPRGSTKETAYKRVPKDVAGGGQEPGPDESEAIRIPLRIDDKMTVRALAGSMRMATCRIPGAMHGWSNLITEPKIKISDSISAVLDEDILCSCLCNGCLHIFDSRYLNHVMGDTVCMEYPEEVEIRRTREHHRIQVNIETQVCVGDGKSFPARMTDISLGGCRLAFSQQVSMTKGSSDSLPFGLPSEAAVTELEAVETTVNRAGETTKTGLSFTAQGSELSKVAEFCEFCSFFPSPDKAEN